MDAKSFFSSFDISDEQLASITGLLFERNYTTEALTFIENHSRILNYWGEGEANILPPTDVPGKRKKYSFIDLAWLYIVKELRDFGMEKTPIQNLRDQLYSLADIKANLELILSRRKEFEEALEKMGMSAAQTNKIIEDYIENHDKVEPGFVNLLMTFISITIMFKKPIYILVNKEGNFYPLIESQFESWIKDNQAFKDFFRQPHVNIPLSKITSHFFGSPYIDDKLRQKYFTKQEWKIIELIRKERPMSVRIEFSEDGTTTEMEVTKKVYLTLEHRLLETMSKGLYGKIEVVFQNGKPVHAIRKQTFK